MSNALADVDVDPAQQHLDEANARFWNELCGSIFARRIGITDHSPESLRKFDAAYFELYPYLLPTLRPEEMAGKSVLEIGLGYGSLSQKIAEAGADYSGMDIAAGPVRMVNHRLRMRDLHGRAEIGNALNVPRDDESLDFVVSIGCFHHTGNVQRCVDETYRVLKPGGTCIVMLYNKFSFREWQRRPLATIRELSRDRMDGQRRLGAEQLRGEYDAKLNGEAVPEVTLHSTNELRSRFAIFRQVIIEKQNCERVCLLPGLWIKRELLLSTLGRYLGLDLYVRAVK